MNRAGLVLAVISFALPAADRARLDAWRENLAGRQTTALLVMQKGEVVYEWYAPGHGPERPQGTASLAKALAGGTSLMIAMRDGKIRPDEPASKYIPAWRGNPRKSRITIRQLATHSSGIEDAEQDGVPHDKLPGWKGAFWRRDPDPFSIAIGDAPAIFEPGSRFHYSNPGMAALAYAVTRAAGSDLNTLLKQRVTGPLGIPEAEWSIGYGRAYELDGLQLYANWGGGRFTPRATARIGEWMMREGLHMAAYAGTPLPDRSNDPAPASGLCWWTNFDGVWPGVPRDAFAGAGAGQQVLLVVPSLRLVVVRNGSYLTPAGAKEFWKGIAEQVFNPVIEALGPPYPASAVIRGIDFAPRESIVRDALGSDNWPVTWGDDGRIYTAYGDGWGFAPRPEKKLSLGLAAVDGPPERFRGVNIRSASGEREGNGAAGMKASGLLMVDRVLYMWVRNVGNAQLAWSPDRGKTWQWGFRLESGFGSPSFLNFGSNYAGARDGYVYTYSQSGGNAYASDDGILLARVPRSRIRDRAAWEFFTGLHAAGRPGWSNEIADRRPAFDYPGRCQRVDAVYNPALHRYLLAVSYGHNGAWGIFDAPEPWGPWTTAFHTEDWGHGGTHGYRLPSKWISPDGRTMHMVFSGVSSKAEDNDAFCVVRLNLEVFAK